MAPLEALRASKTIEWTKEYDSILQRVKEILASDLILSFPDFTLEFSIAADASQNGIGAVLFQEKNDTKKYISFVARSLSSSERNYGATQRELLAIIFALDKFRDYVYGRRFRLYTDHRSLVYLFTQKQQNYMINKWIETLLLFDFDIVYILGILNVLPDFLSRLYGEPTQHISYISREPGDVEIVNAEETRQNLLHRTHLMGHFGAVAIVRKINGRGNH